MEPTSFLFPLILFRHGRYSYDTKSLNEPGVAEMTTMSVFLAQYFNQHFKERDERQIINIYHGLEVRHAESKDIFANQCEAFGLKSQISSIPLIVSSIFHKDNKESYQYMVEESKKHPVVLIASQPALDSLSLIIMEQAHGENIQINPIENTSQIREIIRINNQIIATDYFPIQSANAIYKKE